MIFENSKVIKTIQQRWFLNQAESFSYTYKHPESGEIMYFDIIPGRLSKIPISKNLQSRMKEGIRVISDGTEDYLLFKYDSKTDSTHIAARILTVRKKQAKNNA